MTAESDNGAYGRIVRRVAWLIAALGCAGAVFAGMRWGWKSGAGFLLGAALSYLSFWRWRRITDALGTAPTARGAVGMIVRFFLLIGLAYVIIKYLNVSPVAVLTGLLAAGVSVILALIFELFYART
jgi:hypothetical protein